MPKARYPKALSSNIHIDICIYHNSYIIYLFNFEPWNKKVRIIFARLRSSSSEVLLDISAVAMWSWSGNHQWCSDAGGAMNPGSLWKQLCWSWKQLCWSWIFKILSWKHVWNLMTPYEKTIKNPGFSEYVENYRIRFYHQTPWVPIWLWKIWGPLATQHCECSESSAPGWFQVWSLSWASCTL